MENKELRWKQRYQNFEMAFSKLQEAMQQNELNELERNGLIQRFEFTIDLSWKVLKDYLEEKGFVFKPSPKDTIREAQRAGLIDFGQALIDGLDIRNDLSHDYSGNKFEQSETILRDTVFPALNQLNQFFILEDATE
ncbi:MAG: HI0074 family nucleotidyltransferase substrate-binding subunit [Bacteroidales bacterium]|jgi:nucleotidyltransferase substrate binding protein (TIGR01987 family)|nr:HI0074 family nucleotidyltransferase substrate-binding subunit [Bacteroidales bacterium]HPB01982.1 HI0074 family nucleotidyltransferase substrate-binding subunit [Bacteroidales bacterium]